MPTPITSLLSASHGDRKLRAYAYLTASFQSRGAVHDALDCLIPFVVAGLEPQQGGTLDLDALSEYVMRLGLRIPVYVLEQLRPRLVASNHITWDKQSRRYIALRQATEPHDSGNGPHIEIAFNSIDEGLAALAAKYGLEKPPVSSSWSDALISFLKSESASEVMRSVALKGALIGDAGQIESYITALFIQNSEQNDVDLFNNIVTIFTGILIEDFIDNIQIISFTASQVLTPRAPADRLGATRTS